MSFPGPQWPSWPPHWPPSPSHSTQEIEHRLTVLEETSDDHDSRHEGHKAKLALHERAILGILGLLFILAQDKMPAIAAVIRGLLIP